jgi:murein DD-endopeptidase MepM/ murein hydrolase activator NlpD
MHEGIEISNSTGTSIVASADGLVTTIGTDPDHGRMVVLSHGHRIVTRYGHLEEVEVEMGQRVRKGHRIGKMGSTGLSIGPVLYYEVRVNGIPTNPTSYLYD